MGMPPAGYALPARAPHPAAAPSPPADLAAQLQALAAAVMCPGHWYTARGILEAAAGARAIPPDFDPRRLPLVDQALTAAPAAFDRRADGDHPRYRLAGTTQPAREPRGPSPPQ